MQTSPLSSLLDPTLLKTQALVDGQWTGNGQTFDVSDPATGALLAQVANLGAAETEAAIAAANRAWPAWAKLPAKARSAILMKWFQLLQQHADDLARASVAALWKGRPQRAYNVSDATHMKMGDYFDLAADLYGLPRPPRVPRSTAQVGHA